MKTHYILTFVILTAWFAPIQAQDFTRAHPKESTGKILDIKMDKSGVGYAMSSCGFLLYTENFGASWNEKPADFDIMGLEIVPGTNGEKLVIHSSNSLYFSTDFGDTFNNITPPGGGPFNRIAVLENGNIIVPSRADSVAISVDEGINWTQITEGLEKSKPFFIDFVDNANGWISATTGDIWKTSDGGMSWIVIHADDDPEYYAQLSFANANIGYRSIGSTKLFRTTDSGATWNLAYEGSLFHRNFLVLNDSTLFSYSGRSKTISHDGGLTWTQYEPDVSALYLTVSALNENELWRCGLNKSIQYSADQGETWQNQTNTFKTNLYDIAFHDAQIGAAVGDTGMLLYTTNGGSSWDAIPTGTIFNISGVAFANNGDLLISGGSIGILKSDDLINFNEVWRQANSLPKFYKSPDQTTLFSQGQGWVAMSNDGGDTWSSIFDKPDRSLRAFAAGSNQALFVGDSRGDIHRSIDGGQSWETFSTGSTRAVRAMYFINDQFGYVLSFDSIRVTFDGAETFAGVNTRTQNALKIIMENDSVGWVTGSSSPGSNQGFVYKTNDGWKSFERVYDSCQGLRSMTRNRTTGELWFAGNGGNIETTGSVTTSLAKFKNPPSISLSIYPNPSSGRIRVELPENFDHNTAINIYSISGVQVGTYSPNDLVSNGVFLNPGLYIVSAISPNVIAVGKVIITQ